MIQGMQQPTKTVLLVDDGPNEQTLFAMAGKKAGVSFGLRFASDGVEALHYLNGESKFEDRAKFPLPNLLVLDLNMPRMSGFEVLEWIRRDSRFRELPVVIFTSSSLEADIRRAYSLMANSYLVKPMSLLVLIDMVRSIDEYWFKFNHLPLNGDAPAKD